MYCKYMYMYVHVFVWKLSGVSLEDFSEDNRDLYSTCSLHVFVNVFIGDSPTACIVICTCTCTCIHNVHVNGSITVHVY